MKPADQLAQLLNGEACWPDADVGWEDLLGQARRAALSARLGHAAAASAGAAAMPAGAGVLLQSAQKVGEHVAVAMRMEVRRIELALARRDLRCVLLKGAAYLAAGLPAANGRVFGDVDLLVPRVEIERAEGALFAGGWMTSDTGEYSQRYYREWMHEIPPLTHVRRGSVVDLHHTITPPTSAFRVDGAALLAQARPVDGQPGIWILQPVDMVLHSAVHLFAEGEFDRGLRDLLDMIDLLRHFEAVEPGFWSTLLARAEELGLQRPLHHALFHIERLFGPCVPVGMRAQIHAMRAPWLQHALMAWMLAVALRPRHPSAHTAGEGLVRWLLYVRSHWLRMPLRLLLPHLVRKAWMGQIESRKRKPVNPAGL